MMKSVYKSMRDEKFLSWTGEMCSDGVKGSKNAKITGKIMFTFFDAKDFIVNL